MTKKNEKWRNEWTHENFKKYGGHYIAIKEKQVIASAKSLAKLEQNVDTMKIGKVVIEYIEAPSMVVIYGMKQYLNL